MPNAIDLYSGIGGWALGLKMANIDVVKSYEWWSEANTTHNNNFDTTNEEINIRELTKKSLPRPGSIDFIVGSPPCTQFSFANRGGNGDINDGLLDIRKFLEVIRYLRPKAWAMENIPRVAKILNTELGIGGSLHEFRNIVPNIIVVNIADYGVPQNRIRMIAGNFPVELFQSYTKRIPKLTLGDIINSLNVNPVIDPIYGNKITKELLIDHEKETPLNMEEERMNRSAKTFHPVYNKMNFPDRLNKPSRTVTATCTRVSRESIVVDDEIHTNQYRRLTIRERASIQSFPVSFQFYGNSYSSRIKMIGNAIPPLLTYYIANSMLGTRTEKIKLPREIGYIHQIPKTLPKEVFPEINGKNYSMTRKFKSAIPNLRFGSGVRFELENRFDNGYVYWNVNFIYGNSKEIMTIDLDKNLFNKVVSRLDHYTVANLDEVFLKDMKSIHGLNSADLQYIWCHKKIGVGPYEITDKLGTIADSILKKIDETDVSDDILQLLQEGRFFQNKSNICNTKYINNSKQIFVGLLIGSWFNSRLDLKIQTPLPK